MPDVRERYPIDDILMGHVEPRDNDVVLELGCGRCFTLGTAAERATGVTLVGLDLDRDSLREARAVLDGAAARYLLVATDLSKALPLASNSVDKVICHNVLEQLPDPLAVVIDASRVMRPGATSVWSHTDFESVVISGGDVELNRRVVRAYADAPDFEATYRDGRLGRTLAGIIQRSPLDRMKVDAQVLIGTDLSGPAHVRVKSTYALLRQASLAGNSSLTIDELDSWMSGLMAADLAGEFFYAHTTYIVVARKP